MFKFIIVTVAFACAYAAPNAYDAAAEIRSYKSDLKEDGSYSYQFETTNGIGAQEAGVGGYYASGSAAYYAPDGQLIQLTYTADENGFQPQGNHLPTPPPIPAAILKSLEYIRTHPNQEEQQSRPQQARPFQQQPQRQQFQQPQQRFPSRKF